MSAPSFYLRCRQLAKAFRCEVSSLWRHTTIGKDAVQSAVLAFEEGGTYTPRPVTWEHLRQAERDLRNSRRCALRVKVAESMEAALRAEDEEVFAMLLDVSKSLMNGGTK